MKTRKSMKQFLMLVVVTVLACAGSLVVSFSQQQEMRVETKQEREEKRKELEWYARSVYRGTFDPNREKIPDVIAKSDRDFTRRVEIGLQTLIPFKRPPTAQEILKDRACYAAAVIIGTVKAQTSRLTEDETDIYTINEMEVTSVLKDNVARPIKPGDHINVLRDGGRIEIKGRKAETLYRSALWLEMDRTYLLYLSFVPEKGFYVAISLISHELRDNKIIILYGGSVTQGLQTGRDVESFIASVRAAVAAPCDD